MSAQIGKAEPDLISTSWSRVHCDVTTLGVNILTFCHHPQRNLKHLLSFLLATLAYLYQVLHAAGLVD